MSSSLFHIPTVVRGGGVTVDLELMTLEQLYVRCVMQHRLLSGTVDALLGELNVVLRKDCYDHLEHLMGDPSLLAFANWCIESHMSPSDASEEAFTRLKRDGKTCYWTECP